MQTFAEKYPNELAIYNEWAADRDNEKKQEALRVALEKLRRGE